MFWPNNSITTQPGGYHYMKLEGFFDTISQSYRCHTGPTFGEDYSFELELPIESVSYTHLTLPTNREV